VFRRIPPDDISITPFTSHKSFSFTNNDTGSFGVYSYQAVSQSLFNYASASDSITFVSSSYPASSYTFFKQPTYWWAKNRYYNTFTDRTPGPFNNFGGSNVYTKLDIHGQVNVISIPSSFYGEKIKPGSVVLTDNSPGHKTLDLRDDGFGNLYDHTYSASFAAYQSSSYDTTKLVHSGSQIINGVVGNIFYADGIIVITDTGSLYNGVGVNTGSDGWEINLKSSVKNVEYEYLCEVPEFKFNKSTNITTTFERSGSIEVPESGSAYKFFPPGNAPKHNLNSISASSYGDKAFSATEKVADFVTGSKFAPYITQIGLYNDQNQLLAYGKLANPIKNDDELALGFVVRFDVNS
tara:strand:- start:797 stop:1849 length:1053 start_codon:yes stop_codon:yes gene_type:complete